MEKITSLTNQLAEIAKSSSHLTTLSFQQADVFSWDYSSKTIHFDAAADDAAVYLLHEFGHATLDHRSYERDIELIKMERDAWKAAIDTAPDLKIEITQSFADDALDTYRDWLHARSLCPSCNTTGIQIASNSYRCISCQQVWHVNEARSCALRRYKSKRHSV